MTGTIQPVITLLTFLSATIAILSHYFIRWPLLFYITKPLTTAFILAPVLVLLPRAASLYIPLIGAGLLFAFIGDVLLMFSEKWFVLGIASFAFTHLLYLAAFISAAGLALVNPSTIPLILFAVIMARFLWPGLRETLRIPVVVYVAVITIMTVQAIGGAVGSDDTNFALVAAGAVLFLASDAMLAVDRFRIPFATARALVLSTYWLGQWLIALSAQVLA